MKATRYAHQNGQSLIIIALAMFGMIAFLGLVLDGGGVYASRRRSQDASDSAAFAGVRALALRLNNSAATENSIWITTTNLATVNGVITTTDVVASFINSSGANLCIINLNCGGVPSAATGIRVTTTLSLQPYFISLFIGSAPVPVRAVAAAQSGPGRAAPVLPMTLPFPCYYDPDDPDACPLQYGKAYTLTGDSQLPGGFQWVDYNGGSSANDIAKYLTQYWSSGPVMADPSDTYYNPLNPTDYNTPPPSPNPWIPSGPGVQPDNAISCALDAWLDLSKWGSCKTGIPLSWGPKPSDNKWIVPVYDRNNGQTGSNAKYHVVTFAEFQLLGYWFSNGQCNYVGAPSNPNCKKNLPAELQSCADAGQKCVMGQFLKDVPNLQIVPGVCNSNGLDVCGFGLSQ